MFSGKLENQTSSNFSLAPILPQDGDPDPRILILGSAPSVLSLKTQMYYGNHLNHFWSIMGALLGFTVPKEIFTEIRVDEYLAMTRYLPKNGILLWDVCNQFKRDKSSDSTLVSVKQNDIASLLTKYPSISTIACNGKKSLRIFEKYWTRHKHKFPNLYVASLPSSSPAHAMKRPIITKSNLWNRILHLAEKTC